jgi:hypothetical protein
MVTTSAKEFPCHKQQPQPQPKQVLSLQQQQPQQQHQVPSQQQQLPRRRPPPGFLREPELRAYCGQQMSTTAMLPKVAFASGWRRQQRHCRPRANEETIWERLPRLVIYLTFFECRVKSWHWFIRLTNTVYQITVAFSFFVPLVNAVH